MRKKRLLDTEHSSFRSSPVSNKKFKTEKNRVSGTQNELRAKANETPAFSPRPDWHVTELPHISATKVTSVSQAVVIRLHQHATALLNRDSERYEALHSTSSSKTMLSTFMTSGTLEDRVSALTLLVQESPLHNRKAFVNLLALGKKKNRNQALLALGALKDMLAQGAVLPTDRKLKYFAKQPALLSAIGQSGISESWIPDDGLPGDIQGIQLMFWAYEDWLKRTYLDMIKVLEIWCNDEIGFARSRALTFVFELLREKPEQEENLLRLLINKLGDTDKKIASRTSYLLLQLQTQHPLMKEVIIQAVASDLIFRTGQSLHAKYYAVITLNQTVLSIKEEIVASKLLDIYFRLFVMLLKNPTRDYQLQARPKKGAHNHKVRRGLEGGSSILNNKVSQNETDLVEKLISQLLTGVNRAFKFAKTDDATFEDKMDTLYRTVHSSNFNTSVQALILIQQVSNVKQLSAERFYRTLYESILDPRLLSSSKQVLYLNLLYRSLINDINIKRVKAFVKRLLQVITLHEPSFTCSALFLVSELIKTFPSIKFMLEQPEENEDEEEEHFVDIHEEFDTDPQQLVIHDEEVNRRRHNPRYDGRKRDPEHSNADASCLWELVATQSHFHPSVSLFAERLLYQKPMPPKPDPTLHTLIHFLDRFAYRNAKLRPVEIRGSSIMQPSAATNAQDVLIKDQSGAVTEIPLNTEIFWTKRSEDVDADQVFFHQYFNRNERKKLRRTKRKQEEVTTSDDSENEAEIWNALVKSNTELQGDQSHDNLDIEDFNSDSDVSEALNLDNSEEESDVLGPDNDELMSGSDDSFSENIEKSVSPGYSRAEPIKAKETNKEKRKRLRSLPMFASADDYSQLLDNEEDD